MLIFVGKSIYLLIFQEMLNQEKKNHEYHKGNQNPDNTFVVFCMEFFVFSIGEYHNSYKSNNK